MNYAQLDGERSSEDCRLKIYDFSDGFVGETNCPVWDDAGPYVLTRNWRHVAGTSWVGWAFGEELGRNSYGNPEGTPGDILWQDLRWGDLLSIDTPEKQMETLEIWYARRRYTPEKYGTPENAARKQPHLYDEMVEKAQVRARQETHDEYFDKASYDYVEVYHERRELDAGLKEMGWLDAE